MRIPFAVLALLVIEIIVFVQIGAWLGVAMVVLAVLGSSVLGVIVIRQAGVGMKQLRRPEELPVELAHSVLRLISGLLLVVPGLVTSALGLVLLAPAVRDRIIRRLRGRFSGIDPGPAARGVVIEGEFTSLDPDSPPSGGELRPGAPRPGSPWS